MRLRLQSRKNHIYTQFYRFPNQYRALTEKILPLMGIEPNCSDSASLKICMFGCCSGDEAYSLSSVLYHYSPNLDYSIHAYDIVEHLIEKAQTASYSGQEVRFGPFVSDEFVDRTFDVLGEAYIVKPALAEPVECKVGDILDSNLVSPMAEQYDLVFAQNMLFHLPRASAPKAFESLYKMLKPNGVLFINGMDTDMRIKLTKSHNLEPIDYLIEEIHEDARLDRGDSWANYYYGRVPFSRSSRNWLRKFCTIYGKTKV